MIAYPGKEIILNAFTLTKKSFMLAQPVGYPKIFIYKNIAGVVTDLVTNQVMNEDVVGEYSYPYTVPVATEANATLKVRYEGKDASNNSIFSYDTVDVFDLKLFLEAFSVKKTFAYNPDFTVDTVTLEYGNPTVKTLQLKFTYNVDKTVKDMELT